MSYPKKRSVNSSKKSSYYRSKQTRKPQKKTIRKRIEPKIIPDPVEDVSFIFKNPNLKFYDFPLSEMAKNLAQKFNYRPYMVERYIRMFGEQQTIEFLQANEVPLNSFIRINTLKADENSIIASLNSKGYNLKKVDYISHAYEIAFEVAETEKNNPVKKIPKRIEENSNKDLDFTRDVKILDKVEWGKPVTDNLSENTLSTSNRKKAEIKNKKKLQIGTLGSTHEYLRGYYYIQTKASMLPVFFLNPLENEIIIDMCAAPGGKTTHLAQLMNNTGKIIAVDFSYQRIKSLVYNLRRCGVRNTTVLNINANELIQHNIHSNKILLDAPCSGEGLIRSDKTRKQSKSPKDLIRHMGVQGNLLKNAFKMVDPGGSVMYSTCSIAPEENEFVVQSLLDTNPKARIMDINDEYGSPGYTKIFGVDLSYDLLKARRYLPHIHDTIGFFYCLIKKLK